MRILFTIILVVAAGYLSFVARSEFRRPAKNPAAASAVPQFALTEAAPTVASESTAADSSAVAPTAAPATRRVLTAPPGVYYVTARASNENTAGVIAVLPGESVKLLYRNKDGTARVRWGRHDLTVPEARLTKEFDLTTNQPIPPASAALVGSKLIGQRSNPQPARGE
jgi:hypothetical protein